MLLTRALAHTHTHTHTRPHMSHTLFLSLTQQLVLYCFRMVTRTAEKQNTARRVTGTVAHTGCSVCPTRSGIQRENGLRPAHAVPSSLVNKLFPEVRVMHYHLARSPARSPACSLAHERAALASSITGLSMCILLCRATGRPSPGKEHWDSRPHEDKSVH